MTRQMKKILPLSLSVLFLVSACGGPPYKATPVNSDKKCFTIEEEQLNGKSDDEDHLGVFCHVDVDRNAG